MLTGWAERTKAKVCLATGAQRYEVSKVDLTVGWFVVMPVQLAACNTAMYDTWSTHCFMESR